MIGRSRHKEHVFWNCSFSQAEVRSLALASQTGGTPSTLTFRCKITSSKWSLSLDFRVNMGHCALGTAAERGFSRLSLPFPLCLFPSFRAACNISWILVRWFVLMLVRNRGEFALAFRKCMWGGGTQQQCACAWIGVPVLSVRSRCALPVFLQLSWVWHSCSEQHRVPHHFPSLGQGSSLYCSGLWNLMPRDGTW